MTKILTSHNVDLGNNLIVTENKVRTQRKGVYCEAVKRRHGADAFGTWGYITSELDLSIAFHSLFSIKPKKTGKNFISGTHIFLKKFMMCVFLSI